MRRLHSKELDHAATAVERPDTDLPGRHRTAPAMTARQPGKRRKRPDPQPEPVARWKRWLATSFFAAGGGAFALWGVHDLMEWIHALRTGAPTIETESALLGLIPLGCSIAVLGVPSLFAPNRGPRQDTLVTILFGTALALLIASVLLASIGSLALSAVMRHHGYHVCKVWRGTRMSVTTWAAHGLPCPTEEA